MPLSGWSLLSLNLAGRVLVIGGLLATIIEIGFSQALTVGLGAGIGIFIVNGFDMIDPAPVKIYNICLHLS
jgi:hypothetical protein